MSIFSTGDFIATLNLIEAAILPKTHGRCRARIPKMDLKAKLTQKSICYSRDLGSRICRAPKNLPCIQPLSEVANNRFPLDEDPVTQRLINAHLGTLRVDLKGHTNVTKMLLWPVEI